MKKIKKSHYKSKHTYQPAKGEINNEKSQTVQGEAYTIQELLEKHSTGLMPPIGKEPQYDHDNATHDDDITLRKPNLDLTDIDNLKTQVEETKGILQDESDKKAAAKKIKQKEAEKNALKQEIIQEQKAKSETKND